MKKPLLANPQRLLNSTLRTAALGLRDFGQRAMVFDPGGWMLIVRHVSYDRRSRRGPRSGGGGALLVVLCLCLVCTAARSDSDDPWKETLSRVIRSVVTLHVSATRSFDTDAASCGKATGFVVDAKQGLILTNRHVVGLGPVVAEAVFFNHEEVEVRAIYRDPVHDFGFFRYDPEQVRFMTPVELPLRPDAAQVGVEIRVVGSDAGEKLSILAGTLARMDRSAPHYGNNRYNDFNTFYYQAASGTSGGSSGSPVINRRGEVIALNAGARSGALSSFFLPLDRVVRALERLRAGQPVPRGTLMGVFQHYSYDELRRLGLSSSTESAVREELPEGTGMLVLETVVPGGPADGNLQPGDVLVRLEGELINNFGQLESTLDDRVGEMVHIEVERGGELLSMELPVADLHRLTPDAYLEVGGGRLNALSYHQGRDNAIPVGGAYVAVPGYMLGRAGVTVGALITAVGTQPVTTLEEFEEALSAFPDGAKVAVRFIPRGYPNSSAVSVITVDRRWFPMQRCQRDDVTGLWPCVASPQPRRELPRKAEVTTFAAPEDRRAKRLAPSLVWIDYSIPYPTDGVYGDRFTGVGLVVDAERGLLVADRDTIPVALGDVQLTFAGSVQVPGEVVYLHPVHNVAVVAYDPDRLGKTPIRGAELRPTVLKPGDRVWMVGLNTSQEVVVRETHVGLVNWLFLPFPYPPRFRDHSLEIVTLTEEMPLAGGVLADEKGRVVALWTSFPAEEEEKTTAFFAGLPSRLIAGMVEFLKRGELPKWYPIGAELWPLPLAEARNRGLSQEAAKPFERDESGRRRVLYVLRVTAGTPSAELLREGDLLLSVDDITLTDVASIEKASQSGSLNLRILRDGVEQQVVVPTSLMEGRGTDRAILWAGALLQNPHHALAAQRGIEREGVYVAYYWYGSPADRYGLEATCRIVGVDGLATPDVDAFLAAVRSKGDRAVVRLRTVDLEGRTEVVTLKLDLNYWPTVELKRNAEGWERRKLQGSLGSG